MQNAPSGEKGKTEEVEEYQGQKICEGILRILRIFRVIDPLTGGIVSIIGQQAEVQQACADAGLSPSEWSSLHNLVYRQCVCKRTDQLYVDLCRTVVLFLQELSFAYNFCTPAKSWTIDELQQSFFLAIEKVGKVCRYLSRRISKDDMLGSVLEGFKVVELERDLAVELWNIHFVALERSEDDEVIFQGLEDTTRTCFLGAFADYGRPPVLRELNAKMLREIEERKAAERARCLLFCCLERAATAHDCVDPPIGAVPLPVMKGEGVVKHAALLITPQPFEQISELEHQKSLLISELEHQNSLSRALAAEHKEQECAEDRQAKAIEADCERVRKQLQDLQEENEAHHGAESKPGDDLRKAHRESEARLKTHAQERAYAEAAADASSKQYYEEQQQSQMTQQVPQELIDAMFAPEAPVPAEHGVLDLVFPELDALVELGDGGRSLNVLSRLPLLPWLPSYIQGAAAESDEAQRQEKQEMSYESYKLNRVNSQLSDLEAKAESHAAQRHKNRTRREDEALEMQRKMTRIQLQHAQIVQEQKRQASSSKLYPPASKRARTDDGNGASLGNPTENGEAGVFTETGVNTVDGETSLKE